MATTETSATDSKIILRDTTRTKQNLMAFLGMSIPKSHQVLFSSVVSFIIILLLVAAVSVVAITVSIDKISNHSKTNIHSITQVH